MIKTVALYFVMLLAVAFYASAFFLGYYILLLIFGKIVSAAIVAGIALWYVIRIWKKKQRVNN